MNAIALMSIFQAAITCLFGVAIFIRNYHSRINRAFMYLCIASSVWIVSNSLGGEVENQTLSDFFVRLDFVSGFAIGLYLMRFSLLFRNTRRQFIETVSGLFFLVMILTTFFTNLVIHTSDFDAEKFSVSPGFYAIYLPLLFSMVVIALHALYFTKRKITNTHSEFERRKILRVSLALATVLIVPSSLSGTIIANKSVIGMMEIAANFGLVIFILGVGYAVIKHKLFDIKLVFFRTLTYFLTLSLFASVYFIFIFFILFNFSPKAKDTGFWTIMIIALFSFLPGTFFNLFRSALNSQTKRFFYRDYYNTQIELDKLAAAAVSGYDMHTLTSKTVSIICDAVKPMYCRLVVLNTTGGLYKDFNQGSINGLNSKKLVEFATKQDAQVFSVDDIEERDSEDFSIEEKSLLNFYKEVGVSLALKLSIDKEDVGYLFFGPKLSGDMFSSQDVKFLTIAANEMAIAVQNARRFDEIQRFNETLKREVDHATRELRRSNEKLKALDTAKDEFITMASHQLRTPLTSVKGYLSMVLEGDTGKITNKQRYLLSSAFASSQRMVYLIGDLLNVSRLQTGKFVIEPSVVSLVDMAKGEINQLRETARAKGLTITFNSPKDFPLVVLDETKTRQVMMNFIDNALYYTPQGGKIEVSLQANERKVEFLVKDNGIGVPKSEVHNLFTKFYRAKNARKARPDGTGLGLFMAKKVVVEQGGAILFSSKEGVGSTFGFEFPLQKIHERE